MGKFVCISNANISELDSEERCLQQYILEKNEPHEIKNLPVIKEFIKIKKNEKLLEKAYIEKDSKIIKELNSAFKKFHRLLEGVKYAIGIIKRYPIDFDKRVRKRNSRNLLILDKPIQKNNDSFSTSYLELIQDPNQEKELSKNLFKETIFEIKNPKLKQAITSSSLSPLQEKILRLIYEESYSQREVAKKLKHSEQNIYYWHKKTLKQLKDYLVAY